MHQAGTASSTSSRSDAIGSSGSQHIGAGEGIFEQHDGDGVARSLAVVVAGTANEGVAAREHAHLMAALALEDAHEELAVVVAAGAGPGPDLEARLLLQLAVDERGRPQRPRSAGEPAHLQEGR